MIRILLADDHALFRAGTRRILEEQQDFKVVAEADSGIEAIDLVRETKPDVAILDIGMTRLNGLDAAQQILARNIGTAVLFVSMHCDERYISRAVRAGASGFLLKDSIEQGLIEAVRSVHAGRTYFSPAVAEVLRTSSLDFAERDSDQYHALTLREKQIYQMLGEGNSSKEIAAQLGVSVHTIETHRSRIMEKMGFRGISELVLNAVRRGVVR